MKKLARKKILITAGPTQEPIDPVRYISNHSSGKMGLALACQATKMGHEVLFIHGPIALEIPKAFKSIDVISASEMRQVVLKNASKHDIIIMTAAVADYRIQKPSLQKIKKTRQTLTLKLLKNPDILKELGRKKKKGQILVGFAAETQNLKQYAFKKLQEKNCDYIVANNVARPDIGFGSNENEVWLISANQNILFEKTTKAKIAQKILKRVTQAA